jgi:hypothetical protein
VIDAQRMTELDRVEELKEYVLDQVILAKITSFVQDLAKEITVRAVIHDYEGTVVLFKDTVKGDHIRVG